MWLTKYIFCFGLFVLGKNAFAQNDYFALKHQIDSLKSYDQKCCELYRKVQNKEIDSITLASADSTREKCFESNYYEAVRILNQYGFPSIDKVGAESSYNFWLIVQHLDRYVSFQQRVLDSMTLKLKDRLVEIRNWAYLTDRVNVNLGKPQIYGTQVVIGGMPRKHICKETFDPSHLNERRKSVGLGPIEEYLELMDRRYWGEIE